MFPQAHIVENETDVALAILAGERMTRCWQPDCNHWARHAGESGGGKWMCACHARVRDGHYNTFLCDGTRV